MYDYRAIITKVIDGDTIDATIDLGFSIHTKQRFRLAGIDAPESYGKNKCSAGFTAKRVVIEKLLDKEVTITSNGKDKYGRWLGTIYVVFDEGLTNFNEWLVKYGFAKDYDGGKRS